MTPETRSSRTLFSCIKVPTNDAPAPNETKTNENPSTKSKLGKKILEAFPCMLPSVSSSKDIFDTIDTYPGISGSTQGERKDITPARNANSQLT